MDSRFRGNDERVDGKDGINAALALTEVAFWYPKIMRIVVDTNVFVSACMGVGASNAVARA
jgi:hypothetical protein